MAFVEVRDQRGVGRLPAQLAVGKLTQVLSAGRLTAAARPGMLVALGQSSQARARLAAHRQSRERRIMYMNSDRIGQLATEHHREMLAGARRRQLGQQARPGPGTPYATWTITRRLGTALTRAGAAAARVPHAIRPARPQVLGETPVPR